MVKLLVTRNNVLLVKDDIGKSKPCTVNLPGKDHTYGKPDKKDNHGAGVITSSWVEHIPSKLSASHQVKDFRKLNKIGLSKNFDRKVS